MTSPNGGETWVVGTDASDYMEFKLFRPNRNDLHILLVCRSMASDNKLSRRPPDTSSSYNWTIPAMPPTTTPAPGSPVPKSHMAYTAIYIGNWVPAGSNGIWQCSDTNDKNFKILDNGWAFTISGADKGGANLWFNTDESSFDGYGISLKLGMFKIQGSYTVDANGLITGTYTLLDFESGTPLTNGSGNITTGTMNANATTMTMTWKDLNNDSCVYYVRGMA